MSTVMNNQQGNFLNFSRIFQETFQIFLFPMESKLGYLCFIATYHSDHFVCGTVSPPLFYCLLAPRIVEQAQGVSASGTEETAFVDQDDRA